MPSPYTVSGLPVSACAATPRSSHAQRPSRCMDKELPPSSRNAHVAPSPGLLPCPGALPSPNTPHRSHLGHEVADHAAVVQRHAGAVRVEDAHDAHLGAVLAVVVHGQRLGNALACAATSAQAPRAGPSQCGPPRAHLAHCRACCTTQLAGTTLAAWALRPAPDSGASRPKERRWRRGLTLVVAGALANGVDVAPVRLGLGVLQRVAVHLAGAADEEARLPMCQQEGAGGERERERAPSAMPARALYGRRAPVSARRKVKRQGRSHLAAGGQAQHVERAQEGRLGRLDGVPPARRVPWRGWRLGPGEAALVRRQ